MDQVKKLLKLIPKLKEKRFDCSYDILKFFHQLTQPIKDRIHTVFEHEGLDDTTQYIKKTLNPTNIHDRVAELIKGEITNEGNPKPFVGSHQCLALLH